MRRNSYFSGSQLPAKIMTTPLHSATPSRRFSAKIPLGSHFTRPQTATRARYFGIGVHILLFFCTFYPEIRHISISGLLDLISSKAGCVLRWILSTKFEADPTIRYRDMTPLPHICYVTLWPFDLERLSEIFNSSVTRPQTRTRQMFPSLLLLFPYLPLYLLLQSSVSLPFSFSPNSRFPGPHPLNETKRSGGR